ncbi:hypothetical protein WH50_01620 [Pokkaliibacter plantistimulans]|uniref:GmrSD restriction endonucleases N-terminal domain-containing protein n=1 Tax=Pokkaliibacter plantistimulans TaxID=1635171 RepID=A0ABX5M3B8_9GAMM|nr:DUF262 domain-containing protein [Pokkaliibacter plantistimulans]PXF32879.1 hypothetical protein WH50_01620 [Pokkaliibacter plantistimulans]
MENDWYDDETTLSEESSIKEYDVTASPNDFNLKTLFDFVESGALIIPGFQRNYVWDIGRASKLIESILLGLPIPQIFLYEESRNRFLVIDGQQRLMSIFYFIKQRFPRKEKRVEIRRIFGEYGQIPPEILEDDQYFRKFNLSLSDPTPGHKNRFHGLNYSTLGELKLGFDMRTVRNVIVKQNLPEDDSSAVFEIFNRLNSGGVNLTPQEIRASLYHSKFYDMLFKINNDERWRKLLDSPEADLHTRDVEILLRSFAMLIEGSTYKPSMVKFLNKFSNNCKQLNEEKIVYLKELFYSFLDATSDLPARIFFGTRNRFATLFFEAVFSASAGQAFANKGLITNKLNPEKIRMVFSDKEFIDASQTDTASTNNVQIRLRRAKAIIG